MNLQTIKWLPFHLSKLFNVTPGRYYYQDDYSEGDTPYCSASNENNGIAKKIDIAPDFDGNRIVTGKVGCTAFYQPSPFCATSDVNVLSPNFNMSVNIGLFIVTVINKSENYRWNYGRQCRVGNTKRIVIKLPAKMNDDGHPSIDSEKRFSNEGYIPDWDFMESYINSLHCKPIDTINLPIKIDFNTSKWKAFEFGKLIGGGNNIYKAKAHSKIELETSNSKRPGFLHFITRTETNNGVDCYVLEDEVSHVEQGNAITIGDTTSTIAYQSNRFVTGDHMIVIRADWLNKYTGLFIVSLLRKERFRYSYGRAFLMNSIKNTKLVLPVKCDKNGAIIDTYKKYSPEGYIPDWDYMENYIKSLPYGDRI